MRKHRKITYSMIYGLIVVLVVSLLLMSCSRSQSSTASTDIVWAHFPWGFRGPHSTVDEWQQAKIEQFKKDNPNVNITFEEIPWDNWQAAIATGIASNTPPDIFAFGSWIANDYKNFLEPINNYIGAEKDDFIESALAAGTFDGNIYVWPWLHQGTNIVINLDMVRERGVKLPDNKEGDWTMAEFLEACRLLTHDDIYAFPLFARDTNINWPMVSIICNFGGDLFSADRRWANINTPESLAAFEFMLRMQDEYQFSPPGAAGLDYAQATEMFMMEKLAMNVNGGDFTTSLRFAVEEGRAPKMFNIGYVQFPKVEGRSTTSTRIGPTGFIVFKQRNNAEKRRDAAMAFCKMLTSASEERYAAENGIHVPVRKSLANLYPIYPNFIAAERGQVIYDAAVEETVYTEDIMVLFQSILGHTRTPAEALARFDETVNAKFTRIYQDQ